MSQHGATRFPVHQPKLISRIFFCNLSWSLIKFPASRGNIVRRTPDRRLNCNQPIIPHSLTGTDVLRVSVSRGCLESLNRSVEQAKVSREFRTLRIARSIRPQGNYLTFREAIQFSASLMSLKSGCP